MDGRIGGSLTPASTSVRPAWRPALASDKGDRQPAAGLGTITAARAPARQEASREPTKPLRHWVPCSAEYGKTTVTLHVSQCPDTVFLCRYPIHTPNPANSSLRVDVWMEGNKISLGHDT